MRSTTTFVLLLVAATMALALGGAGSASAFELCKAKEAQCSKENLYKEGTVFKATATEPSFVTSLGTVTCKSSSLEGETEAEGGKPLPAYIGALSFSGCLLGKTECSVTAIRLPYYAPIERSGGEVGTLTAVEHVEGGNPAATFKCGGFINCTAGAKETVLGFEGGAPALIKAEKEVLKKESGAFCPAEAVWTGTYKATSPEQIRMAEVTAKLCKSAPDGTGACPGGEAFSGAISAAVPPSGMEFRNLPIGTTVNCEEAPITGANFVEAGTGEITAMKFETATLACSSNFAMDPVVSVDVLNLPFAESKFLYRSAAHALLAASSMRDMGIRLTVQYGTPVVCDYRLTRTAWLIEAYAPMKMKSLLNMSRTAGNSMVCPAVFGALGTWTVVRTGGDLWVTK